MKMNMEARNHPQTIPIGPAGMENERVEAMEGSSPMILKAIPKTSIMVKLRRSSCLYPSLAIFLLARPVIFLAERLYPVAQRLRHLPATPREGHLYAIVC